MPDFNRMAGGFDRFLSLIHPVTLALLDHLPAPPVGATVLDVACGTGEPGVDAGPPLSGDSACSASTAPPR